MPKSDDDELEILDASYKGQLKSVATKAELAKFKAAGCATAIGSVVQLRIGFLTA